MARLALALDVSLDRRCGVTSARVLLRQAGAGGVPTGYRLRDDTSGWARPDLLNVHARGRGGGLRRQAATTSTGGMTPGSTASWEHATMMKMRKEARMLATPPRQGGSRSADEALFAGDEDLPAPALSSHAISRLSESRTDADRMAMQPCMGGGRSASSTGIAGSGSSSASKPPLA